MCNAGLIVGAILSLVSTAVSVDAQNDAADDAADAIKDQAAVNTAALEDKSEEVTSDANLAKFERQKQLQRDVAATRVAQSEAGVMYGNTALREMSATLIGGGQDLALIEHQEKRVQKQIGRQVDSVQAGAAVQTAGLSWTSPLMAGLQTGTAGVRGGIEGHNAYKSF